jgi:hypothetical protein
MNAGDFVSLLASPGSVPSAIETACDIGMMVRMHLLPALQMHAPRPSSQGLGCTVCGALARWRRSEPRTRDVA